MYPLIPKLRKARGLGNTDSIGLSYAYITSAVASFLKKVSLEQFLIMIVACEQRLQLLHYI